MALRAETDTARYRKCRRSHGQDAKLRDGLSSEKHRSPEAGYFWRWLVFGTKNSSKSDLYLTSLNQN